MFKLEIYNSDTQEMIRENTYKKPDRIQWLLDSASTGKELILFDDQLRTLKGYYVKHDVVENGPVVVYKVYFHYKLSEIQARIAKLV